MEIGSSADTTTAESVTRGVNGEENGLVARVFGVEGSDSELSEVEAGGSDTECESGGFTSGKRRSGRRESTSTGAGGNSGGGYSGVGFGVGGPGGGGVGGPGNGNGSHRGNSLTANPLLYNPFALLAVSPLDGAFGVSVFENGRNQAASVAAALRAHEAWEEICGDVEQLRKGQQTTYLSASSPTASVSISKPGDYYNASPPAPQLLASTAGDDTLSELPPPSFTSDDNCSTCLGRGELLCCDSCPRVFHFCCVEEAFDSSDSSSASPLSASCRPVPAFWECKRCVWARKYNGPYKPGFTPETATSSTSKPSATQSAALSLPPGLSDTQPPSKRIKVSLAVGDSPTRTRSPPDRLSPTRPTPASFVYETQQKASRIKQAFVLLNNVVDAHTPRVYELPHTAWANYANIYRHPLSGDFVDLKSVDVVAFGAGLGAVNALGSAGLFSGAGTPNPAGRRGVAAGAALAASAAWGGVLETKADVPVGGTQSTWVHRLNLVSGTVADWVHEPIYNEFNVQGREAVVGRVSAIAELGTDILVVPSPTSRRTKRAPFPTALTSYSNKPAPTFQRALPLCYACRGTGAHLSQSTILNSSLAIAGRRSELVRCDHCDIWWHLECLLPHPQPHVPHSIRLHRGLAVTLRGARPGMVGLAPNGGGGYVPEEVVDLREVRELKRRCWGRGFVGEFDRVEGDGVAGVWFRKRWMCPLHVDHVLPGQREFREGVAIVDAETGKTVDGSDALREKSGHVVIVNEVDENEVLAGLGKEKGTSIPRNRHSQGSSLPAMMRPHVKVRVKGDPIALRVKSRDTNHKTKVIVVVFPMKRTPFRVSLPPGMPQPRVFAMASGTANKKASAKSNVGIGDVMAGDGRAGRRRSTVGMPGLATTLENAPLAQSSNKSMDVVTVAKVECVNGDATVTIPAVMAPLKSLAVPSLLNSMEPNVVLNIGEPSSQHTLDTHIQSASAPSRQTAEVLVPVHEPQVDADLAATATTSVPIAPSNDENEMDWETKTQPAEQTEPLPPAFVTKPLTLPTGVGSGANASTSTASPSPTVKKKRGRPPHIYRCEVEGCGKSFGQTWHLKRHANIHSESPMFYCLLKEKCDKVFLSQYHLDRHMKSHNNKKAVPPELPAGTLPRPLQLPQMPLVEPSLTEFAFVESDPAANGVMESSAVEGELTEEDSWALLSAGSSYVTDPRHIIVKGKYFCLYSGCGKDLSNQWSFDRHWKNQHYDTKDYSLCDLPGPVSQYKPKPKTKPKPPRAITGGESGAIGSPSSAANSRRSNISFATARKPSGPAGPKYKFPATVDQVACVVPGRATESGKYLIPDVTFRIDFNGAVSFSEGFLDYVDESQWEDVVNGTEGRRETVSVMLEAAGCVEEVAKRTIVEQEVLHLLMELPILASSDASQVDENETEVGCSPIYKQALDSDGTESIDLETSFKDSHACMEKGVIEYDRNGLDVWVTPERYAELMRCEELRAM